MLGLQGKNSEGKESYLSSKGNNSQSVCHCTHIYVVMMGNTCDKVESYRFLPFWRVSTPCPLWLHVVSYSCGKQVCVIRVTMGTVGLAKDWNKDKGNVSRLLSLCLICLLFPQRYWNPRKDSQWSFSSCSIIVAYCLYSVLYDTTVFILFRQQRGELVFFENLRALIQSFSISCLVLSIRNSKLVELRK